MPVKTAKCKSKWQNMSLNDKIQVTTAKPESKQQNVRASQPPRTASQVMGQKPGLTASKPGSQA